MIPASNAGFSLYKKLQRADFNSLEFFLAFLCIFLVGTFRLPLYSSQAFSTASATISAAFG